ncbi:GntR family transcriptional regulator [Streptomyces canus]|uniref:GntR family transcriptional regulator n=1 Tax=Streptomyces canus TaxID=58343 RepID=UPI0007478507|nr:GntR family transcriptional regulator [Streptomyces canus]KUN04309.1 GntR family transcriptional regulator [Streptomyces canus]
MTKTNREPYVRTLEATSMVDRVTKEIRHSILSGSLRPGQQFSLREIADQLGVSFIPVREALRQLEAQGLIVTRPGRSAMVAPLDRADLSGIYRLRRRIEPELASRSCGLLRASDFQRLQAFVSMCGDEDLGLDEIYEAHHAFHLELLRPAATAWELRVLETLWQAAERYIRLAFSGLDSQPEEHRRRKHSHAALLSVFREGEPDLVAQAVLEHLDKNEKIAQTALK